jgi:hypothetical protein
LSISRVKGALSFCCLFGWFIFGKIFEPFSSLEGCFLGASDLEASFWGRGIERKGVFHLGVMKAIQKRVDYQKVVCRQVCRDVVLGGGK